MIVFEEFICLVPSADSDRNLLAAVAFLWMEERVWQTVPILKAVTWREVPYLFRPHMPNNVRKRSQISVVIIVINDHWSGHIHSFSWHFCIRRSL